MTPASGTSISVVIPAYERESTLAATLDSLLAQTHEGWTAHVVDDGSADRTAEVAEGYAARDPRFRVIRQANAGVSAARNAGIADAEHPWLFFLDADDWIAPDAFASLLAASAEADVVHGGFVRVDAEGREELDRSQADGTDIFPILARTCAFSIHSCISRTERVRAAGGFDRSLTTCEDWDLWQRLARGGARFALVRSYVAYYRMRSHSASRDGRQMLLDGLQVISRGHGEDPRLAASLGAPVGSIAPTAEPVARLYFSSYSAGLAIARGEDPAWMLDEVGPPPADPDGEAIAETLFFAVAQGRAAIAEAWPGFPPEMREGCLRFIESVERWSGSRWVGLVGTQTLDRLLREYDLRDRPREIGSWFVAPLDCAADPPATTEHREGIARAEFVVEVAGARVGRVELPICDGTIPPRLLADRTAERLAWGVLGAWFAREVYPALAVEEADGAARILRDGVLLAEAGGPPAGEAERLEWLHEELGWVIALQELWRRPDWTNGDFYSASPEPEGTPPVSAAAGETVAVELTEPLPRVEWEGAPGAVGIRLAGVPIGVLEFEAPAVESHQLRLAVLGRFGLELCRAMVRELILAPAAPAGTGVGEILAAAARERSAAGAGDATTGDAAAGSAPRFVPGWESTPAEMGAGPGATLIGTRARGPLGTSVSRYRLLPAAAREELAAGAARAGDPVRGDGDGGPVAYLPSLAWARGDRAAGDEERLAHLAFDQVFSRPDPWEYDTSPYEQQKYDETQALIPKRIGRALEIGCAEGAFTVRLADRVGSVVACDFSRVALSRAAARCADKPNVDFRRLDLRNDEIPSGFDLIVCSETLYVALESEEELAATVERLAAALAPGAYFLGANARVSTDDPAGPGFVWDDTAFGDQGIAAALRASGWFDHAGEVRTTAYGIRLFRRRRRQRKRSERRHRRPPLTDHGDMGEVAASLFRDAGGAAGEGDPVAEPTLRLPILMYHRIARDGAEETARYRTHPERLERQLELLRDRGFYSVTAEEWWTATGGERKLTGRPILLTFDDGYADLLDEAVPLLERYGFGATFYIVADLVGGSNEWDRDLGEELALLDWDGVTELARRGFEIGSHSTRHRALPTLGPGELVRDLARSKRVLEARLERPIDNVSYPYGLYDAAVEAYAGACGYTYGVTTAGRRAVWGDHPLELPRLEIRGDVSLVEFSALLDRD